MNSSFKFMSFNSSTGTTPLAESTAIGSPLSQRPENNFRGNQKRKPISPLANANSKQRHASVQIDPHVITNAQSRGIVKRLVSYYDESQSEADKNRYVYNRVGDFPIVQLKKTEIKRNIVRSSSVRIAPPSKTVFNRDIRAAILRSNSFQLGANVPKLVPIKMRAKDDSHQIITNHDPLPIADGSPQSAKSVLDALEKNCRKRINNEELTMDRNKRVCALPVPPLEIVDGPSSREFTPIVPQTAKRNRDQISPIKKSGGDSPTDQQQKKKLRTRNNALFCSMSSSQVLLQNQSMQALESSTSSPIIALKPRVEANAEKQVIQVTTPTTAKTVPDERKDSDEKLEVPIKPLKRLYLFNRKFDSSVRPKIVTNNDDDDGEPKINFVTPRGETLNDDINFIRHVEPGKLSMMLSGLAGGLASPTRETPNDSVDAALQPAASISFVTSTTSSTVSPIATPAIATNALPSASVITSPSSILALPTKPSDNSEKPTTTAVAVEAPKVPSFQFGAAKPTTTTANLLLPSVAPVVATSTAESASSLSMFGTPPTVKPASVDLNKSLMSFTPVPKSTETPISVTSPNSITASVAPSLSTLSSAGGFSFGVSKEAPKVAGGLSFGSSSSGIGSSSSLTSNSLMSSTAPLVPSATALTAAAVPTTSPPAFSSFQAPASTTFNFGAKPTMPSATSGISGIAPPAGNSGNLGRTVSFMLKPETTIASGVGFSFSALPTNTVANASSNLAPTTTAPGFGFGGNQNTMTGSGIPVPATTSSFSFGASTAPAFGQPASSTTSFSGFEAKTESQSTAGMFAFGQKNSAPAAPVAATSTFSFSGAAPAVTTQSSFAFGQANRSAVTSSSAGAPGIFSRLGDKQPEVKQAFSFGGSNAQPTAAPPSMFGNAASNTTATNAPTIFGGNSGAVPSQPGGANMFGNTHLSGFGGSQPSTFANNQSSSFAQNQLNSFGGASANTFGSFGETTKPASGNMFAFGASNNNSSQPSTQNSSSAFSFGGSSTSAQNNSQSSGVFGSNGSQNVSQTASFTFKPSTGTVTNNNSPPNLFGQSQNQNQSSGPPPAYQFGNSSGGNSASTTFSFGGSAANAQTAPNGFNFNGPQSAPAVGGFSFPAPQPQPILTPQPSPGGFFNIGTGGGPRRPMRQATRRLK